MNVNTEVVSIPVPDVDKALEFYHGRLGWRLDADIKGGDDFAWCKYPDRRGLHVDRVRRRHPDGHARVYGATRRI